MKAFLSGSQIARSLNFPAESVVSVSLVLNALSCSVVTSYSALRNEGNSPRWDRSDAPSATVAWGESWCFPGLHAAWSCRSPWWVDDCRCRCHMWGRILKKIKCVALNWSTMSGTKVNVNVFLHFTTRGRQCVLTRDWSNLVFRCIYGIIAPLSGDDALWWWKCGIKRLINNQMLSVIK